MNFPSHPEPKTFTHATADSVHGIQLFATCGATPVGGLPALELGCAVFAPARSLSVTGERLAIVLRIHPARKDGANLFLAKGAGQYRLFQPDAAHLCFQIGTDTACEVCAPIPEGWYGAWHTVAAVYDGAEVALAVDGAVLASSAATGSIQYSPGALCIGFDPFTGATGSGAIGELRIYDDFTATAADLSGDGPPTAGFCAQVDMGGLVPQDPPAADPPLEIVEVAPRDSAPPATPGPSLHALPPLEIHEKDNVGRFTGEGFYLEIDLPTATIISWRLGDEELLELGPIHQLWRPPAFAEMAPSDGAPSIAHRWSAAGYAENMMGTTAMEALQDSPHAVSLAFKGLIIRRNSDVLFEVARRYTIYGNGEVHLEQRLTPQGALPPLPRMGLEIRMPRDYRSLVSSASAAAGGISWAALRNGEGYGLLAWSHDPLVVSVDSHSVFQCSEALYPETLTPDSAITLHLDQAIAPPLPTGGTPRRADYGVPATPCETAIRFRGLGPDDPAPEEFVYRKLPQ